jgi:hypothetical protein
MITDSHKFHFRQSHAMETLYLDLPPSIKYINESQNVVADALTNYPKRKPQQKILKNTFIN